MELRVIPCDMPYGTPNPSEVGALLAEYRRARQLSQEKVASLAGLDRTYVGMIERGERNPTLQVTSRILATLGVSWTEFGARLDSMVESAR